MSDTTLSTDEETVGELHRGFAEANKTGHHPFLEEHMAPGMTLIWYNLNQSNYYGVDHIVELWKMLAAVSARSRSDRRDPRRRGHRGRRHGARDLSLELRR